MWKNILKDDSNDKNWSKFQEVLDKYSLDVLYVPLRHSNYNIKIDKMYITWGEGRRILWEQLVTRNVDYIASKNRCLLYNYILGNVDKDFKVKGDASNFSGALYDETLEAWTASLKAFDWFRRSVPDEFISSDDNIMYIEILGGTMSVPLTSSCNNSYENDEGVVFNMCLRARDTEVIASPDNWLSYYLIYSQLAKLDNYEDIEEFSQSLGLPDVIYQTIRGTIDVRCGNCEEVIEDITNPDTYYEWDCKVCGFTNELRSVGEIASEEGVGPYINGIVVGFDCPFGHRVYGNEAVCQYHHISSGNDWPSDGWEHIDYDFQIGDDYFYTHDDQVLNVYNVTEYTISDYLSSFSADALLGYGQDEYILTEHPDVDDIGEYNNQTLWKDSNYYYYYDEDGQIQYSETNPNDEDE